MRLKSAPQLMVVAVAWVGGFHVLATDAPRWADDILREKGIVSREELIRALEYRETRELAADKLARDQVKDAIPFIRDAFVRSSDPFERINIAAALAKLQSDDGVDHLLTMCSTGKVEAHRIEAARRLAEVGNEACFVYLIEILQAPPDSSHYYAFGVAKQFKKSKEPAARRMLFDVAVLDLESDSLVARGNASKMLVALRDTSAAPVLQAAIDREKVPSLREQMIRDLRVLVAASKK